MRVIYRTIAAGLILLASVGAVSAGELSYIVPVDQESAEGEPVPDVIFADGSGMPIHLNRYVGFVVVLSFWSEHCGPCLKQLPTLDRLQGNFRGTKLLVLPVSLDQGGAPAAKVLFSRYHFMFLRPYADPGGNMARTLGVKGIPTTFIIDRHGRAVARIEGEHVWDSDDMMHRFAWLMQKP